VPEVREERADVAMSPDLRRTAELPAVESMADLHRDDPARVYTHRRYPGNPAAEGSAAVRLDEYRRRQARDWKPEALDRLLNNLNSGE
jgi:hypothetical protein